LKNTTIIAFSFVALFFYLCKIAVQQNHCALRYVKEQTDELCKIAVQQNGGALRYVKEQTDELCKIAVQQNRNAIIFVRKQVVDTNL
jgi:hypothetical protein